MVCNFTVPAGNVTALVNALNQANANVDLSIICLTNSTYTLTTAQAALTGLPLITTPIEIRGDNATITRSASAPQMRIIQVTSSGNLTLRDLTITGGLIDAADGGGVYNVGGRVSVVNTQFSGHSARNGGGIYNNGGVVTITNSTIRQNTAPNGSGGGLLNVGVNAQITISGGILTQNTATTGGAIYNTDGVVDVTGSVINTNSAVTAGGLFNNEFGRVIITNTIFTSNTSVTYGGALSTNGATMRINNSCISNNNSPIGSGIVNLDTGTIPVDATLNWWGAASGPGGDGPGTGDAIFGNIAFIPFLTSAPSFCAAPGLAITQQPSISQTLSNLLW